MLYLVVIKTIPLDTQRTVAASYCIKHCLQSLFSKLKELRLKSHLRHDNVPAQRMSILSSHRPSDLWKILRIVPIWHRVFLRCFHMRKNVKRYWKFTVFLLKLNLWMPGKKSALRYPRSSDLLTGLNDELISFMMETILKIK